MGRSTAMIRRESAKVRILGPCDRPVTMGFGLATNDPAFELFRKLPIADLGIDRWESHDTLTEFGEPDRFATSGRFIATEFVTHVNAKVMHDHRDAGCTGSVWTEYSEKWSV